MSCTRIECSSSPLAFLYSDTIRVTAEAIQGHTLMIYKAPTLSFGPTCLIGMRCLALVFN